ncbi:MAG: sugar phosphate isomerase/epimerase family protein [Kiritimatiellia bacterium]|jgi:sugar phosphate isomerase/epimerase
MALPLSVQLYSVRDYCEKDFIGTLKKIADIGFKGVEPAGFWNVRPSELKKIVEDLGMTICSSHSPWANPGNLGEAMDIAATLGLDTVTCGYGPEAFQDLDAIQKTAEQVRFMQELLARNGFTLFQHNHFWEFERIDGKLKYEIYRELCPNVKFEMDCFWSTNKGQECAVEMLKTFLDSTILLHMKDGICRQQASNEGMKHGLIDMKIDLLPLGTGDLPIPELIAVASTQPAIRTVIVELDYCEIEMFEALSRSYAYMTENGLAVGNK